MQAGPAQESFASPARSVCLRQRLLDALVRSPGQTASQLAACVIGGDAKASGVQFTLTLLELRGLISRAGDGGRGDPFRYFPTIPGR